MRNRTLAAVAMAAIIGVFLGLSLYYGLLVERIDKIEMDLTVGDKVGFFSDRDALHFGTVYPGGSSRRSVVVTNENDYQVKVIVRNSGNLSGWVTASPSIFLIGPHSAATINYSAEPALGAKLARYKGQSKIIIRRI